MNNLLLYFILLVGAISVFYFSILFIYSCFFTPSPLQTAQILTVSLKIAIFFLIWKKKTLFDQRGIFASTFFSLSLVSLR